MNNCKTICAFDLDGTLDLKDKNLSAQIIRMARQGVEFVPTTGRTNNYVRATCKKYNIIPPKFIIADNGGTVFDNRNGRYLKKIELKGEKRKSIIEEYIKIGGRLEDIRYTDGERVYVVEDKNVRKYYEKEDIIDYRSGEDIIEAIMNKSTDITKIALAGNRDQMNQIVEFIKNNDINCWTDIGTTKFPIKERKNYRLDIMDGECSKGEAIRFLRDYTGINNFTCIGNGLNDFSMFKFALDCGMPVIVVQNFENRELSKESKAITERVMDYAKEKGVQKNVTVASFPINNHFSKIVGSTAKQRRKDFARGIEVKPKIVINTVPKGSQAIRDTRRNSER